MDPNKAQQAAAHMFAVLIPMILLFWVIGAAIVIIPFWQIFKKAGLAPALSLLMIIPAVNLVMLYVLAFSEWRVLPFMQGLYAQPQFPPAGNPPQPVYSQPPVAATPVYQAPEPPAPPPQNPTEV